MGCLSIFARVEAKKLRRSIVRLGLPAAASAEPAGALNQEQAQRRSRQSANGFSAVDDRPRKPLSADRRTLRRAGKPRQNEEGVEGSSASSSIGPCGEGLRARIGSRSEGLANQCVILLGDLKNSRWGGSEDDAQSARRCRRSAIPRDACRGGAAARFSQFSSARRASRRRRRRVLERALDRSAV